MASSETALLMQQLDAARSEARYYKTVAAQTGNLRLREAENLSLTIQNLKQAKESLSKEVEERKRIENELRASDAKYRSIMESMNDEVYVISSDFLIEYANPAMSSRIGRNSIGKSCHKMIFDQDERCSWCPFERIRKEAHVEYELLNPKNNRSYAVTSTPVYHVDGGIAQLSISRDITEKKAIEADLRQARKMESIGILAGGIAHDFNNLLQVIIGCTELSLRQLSNCNPAYNNMKTIQKSSLRATGIVRQLLNFSRKAEIEKKVIDIIDVIQDTLIFMRSTIPNTIYIGHHLPDRRLSILGDEVQIGQILINICANAFQAMEKTGGSLDISVDTVLLENEAVSGRLDLSPGEYVSLVISDTGPGIAPELQECIFDPYFTTKEIGKGTGMGLAVVHGIVKCHGGIINVDSPPGQGAVFEIFFPLVEEIPHEETKPEDSMPTGNEKILFVDDEQLIAKMAENVLERLGYSVESRTNPTEALALFQSDPHRFDLVITDMTMPQMTGIGLYNKLKSIRTDIPAIVCTGYSPYIDETEAKKLGVNAFMMKPFSPIDLAKTIRTVLDGNSVSAPI